MLARELEERPVRADAGVRDDDVEPAEALDRRLDRGVDLLRVAHVAGEPVAALEAEVVAAPGGEADRRARVVEHPRDRGADPAARAGDERCSAFEAHFTPLIAG